MMAAPFDHRPRLAPGRVAMKMLACIVGVLATAGCFQRVRPHQPVDRLAVFTCAGDYRFSARELNEVATVRLPTRTIALPRVRVASGARYRTDSAEFWNRGQTATLRVGAESHADCTPQSVASAWDEARLLGVDYRAAGAEPQWSLEIDEGNYMRFIVAGGSPVYMPAGRPVAEGARMVLRTGVDDDSFEVSIEQVPCRDASFPDPLPETVKVTYNGFPYIGCGRRLTPS